jgi:hypothetical protein
MRQFEKFKNLPSPLVLSPQKYFAIRMDLMNTLKGFEEVCINFSTFDGIQLLFR